MAYETVDDLPRVARTVHRVFRKHELQQVAEELGLTVGRKNTRQLVLEIINDLEDRGLPDVKEASDELFEFMLNIEFIDENGNILEVVETEKPEVPEPVNHKWTTKPECYSLADIRDPACKRCILIDECLEQRVLARPPCYGKMYSVTSEECMACIEAGPCREVLNDATT